MITDEMAALYLELKEKEKMEQHVQGVPGTSVNPQPSMLDILADIASALDRIATAVERCVAEADEEEGAAEREEDPY